MEGFRLSIPRLLDRGLLMAVAVAVAAAAVLSLSSAPAVADPGGFGGGSSVDGVWHAVAESDMAATGGERWVRPLAFRSFRIDRKSLDTVLRGAPPESRRLSTGAATELAIPMPDGRFARFAIWESSIMEAPLAAAYPEIRTYAGRGLDDPEATVRLDWTLFGFHAMVLSPQGTVFVDPYRRGDLTDYISYDKRDFVKPDAPMACQGTLVFPDPGMPSSPPASEGAGAALRSVSGATLRTFRLAVGATGEYTAWFGGTVAAGLSAITTTVNRVTGVYERELAIRLVLVANETSVIYTNAATDPYDNASPSSLLTQNQTTMDSVIGSANYDIGHVFSTGGGGLSGLGVVCRAGSKARSETGSPAPMGDPYDIDYVAHEMGHQFGATHTFNGTTLNCGGGNRSAGAAYEPGSASTIMGYAGICGAEDLQGHSDAYFHTKSYDEIEAYITTGSGTCVTPTSTGNNPPTVDAGANYTIPAGTPFILTASGSDPDGDSLTYCWEEFDLGTAAPPNTDDGSRPIFRSFKAAGNPYRTFPKLSDVLSGTSTFGESLPTTSRTMTFRVTARDGKAGGGGVAYDSMQLTTTAAAGPFVVTQPNTALSWTGNSTRTVTWNVAGTASSPVSTANVRILLSTDGGYSFPTVLIASTPNDGTEAVMIPNTPTTTARIKVEAVGNVFFDVSDVNFTIAQDPNTPLVGLGTVTRTAVGGDGDGWLEPGEAGALSIQILNSGSVAASGVSAHLLALTVGATVISSQEIPYPDVPAHGSSVSAAPFLVTLASSVPCGQTIDFSLVVTRSGGAPTVLPFSITTGEPDIQVFSYTDPVVAIPDNSTSGVDIPLVVSGYPGVIPTIAFRVDGTNCSPAAGSTTAGITHLAVGDLAVKLTSPASTTVTLMTRPGGASNTGNHFCQTLLDDAGASSIQSIVSASAPFTGIFSPANPLSAFKGQDPNGTWTLNVADLTPTNTGNVRKFSLIISGVKCNAPLPLPGSLPGSGPAGGPLTVSKEGGAVTLSWGASCNASGVDYAVYEGTVGSWYSHTSRFCTTQGQRIKSFTPGAGNRYFLVVPLTADREGSYGENGNSIEIPAAAAACKVQSLGGCP
jgi:subtilisin-like proprotein convertase family protein